MDLTIFKEKNDKDNGVVGSGIFEYRKLREFEKVLFLEHNVKELIGVIKRKNNHISEVESQLVRVIDDYEESKQVAELKRQVTLSQGLIKKYKDLYFKSLESKSKSDA